MIRVRVGAASDDAARHPDGAAIDIDVAPVAPTRADVDEVAAREAIDDPAAGTGAGMHGSSYRYIGLLVPARPVRVAPAFAGFRRNRRRGCPCPRSEHYCGGDDRGRVSNGRRCRARRNSAWWAQWHEYQPVAPDRRCRERTGTGCRQRRRVSSFEMRPESPPAPNPDHRSARPPQPMTLDDRAPRRGMLLDAALGKIAM